MNSSNLPELAAISLNSARIAAELELISSMIQKPAEAMPLVKAADIQHHDIGEPDLRAMFIATEMAAEHQQDRRWTLSLAKAQLQADGLWDDSQLAENWPHSMRWSDASLLAMADSSFHSVPMIRLACRRLRSIVERQRRAADHLAEAERLIADPHALEEPGAIPVTTSTPRVVVTMRKRGAA